MCKVSRAKATVLQTTSHLPNMARARYGRYMSTCQTVVVCLLYTLSSVNCLQLQLCDFPNFDSALAHFAKALTFKTVSDPNTSNHAKDPQEFAKLDEFLSSTYTAVWDKLKVEKVGRGYASLSIHTNNACLGLSG